MAIHNPLLQFLFLLLLTSNSSSDSMAPPNAGEVDALRTIMRDWGNPAALTSWSAGNWAGVTCNSNGQVTALSFTELHIANPIPASICSLEKLSSIDLSYNNLTGEFPTALYGCSALQFLDLSNNQITGSLPGDIDKLSSEMQHLNLSSNGFIGDVPSAIGRILKLKSLVLDTNRFSGSYPAAAIAGMVKLETLTLASNPFASGPVPEEFGELTKLTTLNNNALTGDIPPEFGDLHLSALNLSVNELTGEVPLLLQSPAYDRSFLGNRRLCATVNMNMNMNLPACEDGPSHSKLSIGLISLFSVLAGVAFVGAVAIGCLFVRRKKHREDLTVWKMTPFRAVDFSECDIITNLREENVIGSGGFGKVYRVHLRVKGGAGVVVAVKRLGSTGKSDSKLDKEFDSEVKILGDIRHNNIVSLLCCISGGEATKLLVYEYMENGSLDRWLHRRERAGAPAPLDWPRRLAITIDRWLPRRERAGAPAPLGWPTRLAIAIDVARGLSYMHHESVQPIMHGDVNSSNILLDRGFRAKVDGFGLAKSGESESVSAGGTFGYMAPEYVLGAKVNEKTDVYSFGVVLLELTTGRVAGEGGPDYCCLQEWACRRYKVGGQMDDAVDGDIQDRAFLDDVVAVFRLGVRCTRDDTTSRPSMKEVLDQLLRYDRTSSVASATR